MSRYEFTTTGGYHVMTLEARTAREAGEIAANRTSVRPLYCTHLSDSVQPAGMDAIFFYGPDAVEVTP